MPGLIACKRRWNIGSDDLFFPAVTETILRAVWLIAICALFWSHKNHESCTGAWLLHFYLIGLQVWLIVVIVLNLLIVWLSAKGTIVQVRPRRHMPKLLYARLFLSLVEVAWNVMGTLWAFRLIDAACEDPSIILFVQIATVSCWFILSFFAFCIWLVFDPMGSRKGCDDTKAEVKSNKVWAKRLKFLCCCTNYDQDAQDAYSEVAVIFASYFHDVDLVPSDLAVGLLLLQEKLLRIKNEQNSQPLVSLHFEDESCPALVPVTPAPITAPPSPSSYEQSIQLISESTADWMTIPNALHFSKYAFGIYGWPLFMLYNASSGICQLWNDIKCCMCFRPSTTPETTGDNCCMCNFAALKSTSDIQKEEDLIYASFHNEIYQVPFYVALDHQTSSVVLGIRGSLSFKDALTDLIADVEPLKVEGCKEEAMCHRGMMKATRFVTQKLAESQALQQAFTRCPNYGLVIVGHSLGAGVASLLSVTLRPQYPTLKCFAYSPPAGLVTSGVAEYSKDFLMSVILGDDVVCRLSIHSMTDMKKQVIETLMECNEPKCKVLAHGCWSVLSGRSEDLPLSLGEDSRSPSPSTSKPLTSSTLEAPVEGNKPIISELRVDSSRCLEYTRPKFYVPGKILHVVQTPTGFQGTWTPADHFDHITISTSMIMDHMPNNVHYALSQLSEASIGWTN